VVTVADNFSEGLYTKTTPAGPSGPSRFEEDPIRADFLRRYSLDRLPNDPKLRQRAADFLRKQGKEDLAREMEARGQKSHKIIRQITQIRCPLLLSEIVS
jgi:hypothetical protein